MKLAEGVDGFLMAFVRRIRGCARAGVRHASGACRSFGRRPTLMFNGYGDQVASMYSGMDLAEELLSSASDARPACRQHQAVFVLALRRPAGWRIAR